MDDVENLTLAQGLEEMKLLERMARREMYGCRLCRNYVGGQCVYGEEQERYLQFCYAWTEKAPQHA